MAVSCRRVYVVKFFKNELLLVPPVSEVVSEVDERQGDAEPHGSDSEHGGEGYRSTGVLAPDEQVHKEADAKDYSRVECSSEEGRSLK